MIIMKIFVKLIPSLSLILSTH